MQPTGTELWKSDGTAAGTVLVQDIVTKQQRLPGIHDGGWERSISGPTIQPTGSSCGKATGRRQNRAGEEHRCRERQRLAFNLTAVGSTLYFVANDGTNGSELWKSDGTATGTVRVKDILPGTGSSSPSYLTAIGGTVYFRGQRWNHR